MYGRQVSSITSVGRLDEQARRSEQRESLVAALEVQVREKEAQKLVSKLRKWDEDQAELFLLGIGGAGKPRPPIPAELLPFIHDIAPEVLVGGGGAYPLNPGRLPPTPAPGGAGATLAGAPFRLSAAGGSGGGLAAAVAAASSAAGSSQGGAEAHLDRVLRTLAPGLAEQVAAMVQSASVAAASKASQEALERSASERAASMGGDTASVAALAGLLKELLEEQRSMRSALLAASSGSSSGGGGSSGPQASAPAAAARGTGSQGVAALRRAAGKGAAATPSKQQQQQQQQQQSRAPPLPPRGPVGEVPPPSSSPVGGGALPRTNLAPRRPPFGRHAEGAMTAEERRRKGEARTAAAAERRRLALEDFRAAQGEARESKARERAGQRGLRREMAFNRGGVLAAQQAAFHGVEGGGGLGELLAASPVHEQAWKDRYMAGGGGGGGGGGGAGAQQRQQEHQQGPGAGLAAAAAAMRQWWTRTTPGSSPSCSSSTFPPSSSPSTSPSMPRPAGLGGEGPRPRTLPLQTCWACSQWRPQRGAGWCPAGPAASALA